MLSRSDEVTVREVPSFREQIRAALPNGAPQANFAALCEWEDGILALLNDMASRLDQRDRDVERLVREGAAAKEALEETNRRLHRRVQAAESALAQATPEKVEKLDAELAAVKVERHKLRNEVAFMKSERRRLKQRIRELEHALSSASVVAGTAETGTTP